MVLLCYGIFTIIYTYCHNNPVLGIDPTGHFFDTLFDVVSLVVDVVEFVKEPTPMGAVNLLCDVVGLVAPGVPSAGLKAGVKAVGAAADAIKAADKVNDVRKAVEVVDDVHDAAKVVDNTTDALKQGKQTISSTYRRPSGFRKGVKDQAWENAKDAKGFVRDPVTKKIMNKNDPWDMGHKPGYEFRKHQASAQARGISRKQFLDEYNQASSFRPELPSSNRSHKGEDLSSLYLGH